MCLSCSGVHRGLGVHISFIRSITMDAFKGAELARMAVGGNKPFQDFFNGHVSNTKDGRTFEASSIQERYDCEAGDEWKERLSCKIESREFDKSNLPKRLPKKENAPAGAGAQLSGRASAAGSRSHTPLGKTRGNDVGSQRSSSPALGTNAMSSQKARNENYFAKMGAENANRPDGLAPNQGGKFGGFGSEPDHWKKDEELGAPPELAEFQKDPVAALTKGFGWLGASVSKVGKTGYEGWVKPGMQKVHSPHWYGPLDLNTKLTTYSSPKQTSQPPPNEPPAPSVRPSPRPSQTPAQPSAASSKATTRTPPLRPPSAPHPRRKTFGTPLAMRPRGLQRTSRISGTSLRARERRGWGPARRGRSRVGLGQVR
jgi:hypothetical protein